MKTNVYMMSNWTREYGYGDMMVILAKEDETLLEHTENTLKVLKSMKECYPEIPDICGIDNFWDNIFYSLFFHDFGKASYEFQEVLLNKSKTDYWDYRHEIISASFVDSLDFLSDEDKFVIRLGIITHHKDITTLVDRYKGFFNHSSEEYDIFFNKLNTLKDNIEELNELYDRIPSLSKKYLGHKLKKPKKLSLIDLKPCFDECIGKYLNLYEDYQMGLEDDLNNILSIYGLFIKGVITTCDHLASAGIYNILKAKKTFKSLDSIKKTGLRKTQTMAYQTTGDTFLIAPTGSGKTEASLLWSMNNQNELMSKRVFYILPYTASINAMYERLKDEYSETYVGLLHGKSSYYLYKESTKDSYEDKKEEIREIKNLTKKIYKPYKILTPFQIIKYFFKVNGYEMGLTELTNSLLIFDEIHSYDPRTTALILSMLKYLKYNLHVSVMIMSATIPSFLLKKFRETLCIPNIISLEKKELDSFTRHKINILRGSIFDYVENIFEELYEGKKVLIVCNTIQDAQKMYELIDINNSALLHSRFILKDRQIIESKLKKLNLLIGTQAIEVSLDIDYDVLFTQPAPLDALIQRFGRVNRRGWEENIIKNVNICTIGSDHDNLIYDEELIHKTIESLQNIDILRESSIQELLDDIYQEGYNKKSQEIFDDVTNSFEIIKNDLTAFLSDNSGKNELNKLFDSVEVVPYKFFIEYTELLEEKKYYEAMAYTVNISYKRYLIEQKKNNIITDNNNLFIDAQYDSEIGLQFDYQDL